MKHKKTRNRILIFLFLIAAITAISWDITTSLVEVEKGTFRYESEFDALTGATATVGIVTSDYSKLSNPIARTTNPSYEQIEEMVAKAIELQGGFEWIIDKGDVVLIKVNLVGGNSPSGQGENTDVRVVKALIKNIAYHTEGDVTIQIAEGTARMNDDPTDPKSVWGNSGYIDLLSDPYLAGIKLSLVNLNQGIDDLIEIDLGKEATAALQGTKYKVHRAELEADVYIAVPVLKIHDTGITNALKLQIGSAPGCYYGYNKSSGTSLCPGGIYHVVGQRVWTTEAIVDLCNIADIDFVLVDAIMCLQTQKGYSGSNQLRYNTIIAGADVVAVDHVSAKLMGINPDDVAHITLAEKVGLGTNNSDDITVEGVSIEQAMIRAKKRQHPDGIFGQSNRTWILSQAFEGSDIKQEFFKNEASIQPIPGDTGWSQPVYFFDDRIDLYSFYGGQTNIISYAFTYFNAKADQEAELWLGTHEAIIVYINGEEVYNFNSTTSYGDADREKFKKEIKIKQGKNTLLVKTLNKFGDYTFALNICVKETNPLFFGNRVEGLKFFIDDSGTGTEIVSQKNSSNVFSVANSLKCYPNPAHEHTKISFNLSNTCKTEVNIYDIRGRLVKTIVNDVLNQGKHDVIWHLDGLNTNRVKSGIYICTVLVGNQKQEIKLVVQ